MAFTVVSVSGKYAPALADKAGFQSLALSTLGNNDPSQVARATDQHMFEGTVTAPGAEASAAVLDLTARGVTFPAGYFRTLRFRLWYVGNTAATENGYAESLQVVIGGTTPTLITAASSAAQVNTGSGIATGPSTIQALMVSNNVNVALTTVEAEPQTLYFQVYVDRPVAIPARPGA